MWWKKGFTCYLSNKIGKTSTWKWAVFEREIFTQFEGDNVAVLLRPICHFYICLWPFPKFWSNHNVSFIRPTLFQWQKQSHAILSVQNTLGPSHHLVAPHAYSPGWTVLRLMKLYMLWTFGVHANCIYIICPWNHFRRTISVTGGLC